MLLYATNLLKLVRKLVAHGEARERKWRGNWRMEWVASTLTPPPNVVYRALLKLMRTPRLPAVDWTDAPTDLNGLVRFGERSNLVSARVPSRSARAITQQYAVWLTMNCWYTGLCFHGTLHYSKETNRFEMKSTIARRAGRRQRTNNLTSQQDSQPLYSNNEYREVRRS